MAVHYEVEEGKTLVIDGPANVVVRTGKVPIIGTPVKEGKTGEDSPEVTEHVKAKK
jgi:hypothetical protein